jgi:hypothetical protein
VNYQQDLITLYAHLARAFIERDKNFNIFQSLGVASYSIGLPSWVPDWSVEDEIPYPLRYDRDPNLCCKAGGSMSISVTFTPNGKELVTDGMVIDRISSIGDIVGPQERGNVAQDWEAVAGKVCGEKYISGGSMIDAFLTTVFVGYPRTTLAVVKRQLMTVYKKGKKQNPAAFSQSFRILYKESLRQDIEGRSSTTQDDEMEQFLRYMNYTMGRRFCVTDQRYFALVPGSAKQGDCIALLRGGSYPVALRANGSAWEVVGECYIHGVMQGELYEDTAVTKLTLI